MNRNPLHATVAIVVAAALATALTGAANWRLALLAVLAAGASAATRIRYARLAALALLAAVLALATAGASAGSDDRATSDAAPRAACANVTAGRRPQAAGRSSRTFVLAARRAELRVTSCSIGWIAGRASVSGRCAVIAATSLAPGVA